MGGVAGALTPGSGIVGATGGVVAQEFDGKAGACEVVQTAYSLQRAPMLIGHDVSSDFILLKQLSLLGLRRRGETQRLRHLRRRFARL